MRSLFGVIVPAVVVGLIGAAAIAPVSAREKDMPLRPATAHIINMGYVNGVAYYTQEPDGFHVVATLSVGGGAPVRVLATLQPEQAVSFSVPGADGTQASVIQFSRHGESLSIDNPERVAFN
ncbi:hypothetical protein MWN34_01010 [Ancylobacter sp. 6x-1]|uniref:Uncharacterized protein n=1 Tax=Ancylobacter crimeensis TaxID=2579147 RepID=A0ABT0D6B4_9HYPH|nr:hypothetical protein [Ancylobacter crimeensis]MCK0195485.1 hypothetical protein [Ancylobacter crimeensis]